MFVCFLILKHISPPSWKTNLLLDTWLCEARPKHVLLRKDERQRGMLRRKEKKKYNIQKTAIFSMCVTEPKVVNAELWM